MGNKCKDIEGLAFVGAFFLGFSIGPLLDKWAASPFLAIALAFMAMAITRLKCK